MPELHIRTISTDGTRATIASASSVSASVGDAHERAFVLVPWSQADPFAELGGHTVTELADRAPDRSGLRWLAFDWLDTDNIPEKPTGPYVAPPVADDVPEPVEQVYNATRNERSVMDAELAAEYLAGIGELPPQEAAAKHPVN